MAAHQGYVVDPPYPLPFQIIVEVVRENLPPGINPSITPGIFLVRAPRLMTVTLDFLES